MVAHGPQKQPPPEDLHGRPTRISQQQRSVMERAGVERLDPSFGSGSTNGPPPPAAVAPAPAAAAPAAPVGDGSSPPYPPAGGGMDLQQRMFMQQQQAMASRMQAFQMMQQQQPPATPPAPAPPTPTPPAMRRMPSGGRLFSASPNQSIRSPSPSGLDLLRSASLTMPHGPACDPVYGKPSVTDPSFYGGKPYMAGFGGGGPSSGASSCAPSCASSYASFPPKQQFLGGTLPPGFMGKHQQLPFVEPAPPPLPRLTRETSSDGRVRLYIDEILQWDVLCGRGGRSNHHAGNKRYRHVVSEMKAMYRDTDAKNLKTDLSRAIVEHVCNYGGRFIKKDETKGRYYVLTKSEARKKTSQALRETKELKWTL